MPYARPTLTVLRTQAMQDVTASGLPNADGFLRRSVLRILAWVQAGLAYLHFSYLDWISLQSVPFTAQAEYLEGWAALKGVYRKAATAAVDAITISGTAEIPVAAGAQWDRSDGTAYVTTADVTIGAGGTVTAQVQCLVTGSAGSNAVGTTLQLSGTIPGVQPEAQVTATVSPGTDTELDDSLRTRMLLAYAEPPQGGDRADYIEWALATPGVTRAWVAPNGQGAGTVSVFTMFDQAEAANGGFPQGANGVATGETRDTVATGDQLTVANAIYPLQPVTALVYSDAPVATPVPFTVSDLGANNTETMQGLITTALQQMFVTSGNVGGTVNPETGQAWPAIEPDDWYAALQAIPGLTSFKVPTPAAAITPAAGQLFTVGAITFNT